MIKSFLLLSILSFNICAGEYIQACFNSEKLAVYAQKKSQFILTNADKIEQSGSCVDYVVDDKRVVLLKKYLLTNFQGRYQLSSEVGSYKECNLKLVKIENINKSLNNVKFSDSFKLSANNLKNVNKTSQTLKVQSGKFLELRFGSREVVLLCKVKSGGYDIKIDTSDKVNRLSSSFFLAHGSFKKIGDFNENNAKDEVKLDINKKVSIGKKSKLRTYLYFLSTK